MHKYFHYLHKSTEQRFVASVPSRPKDDGCANVAPSHGAAMRSNLETLHCLGLLLVVRWPVMWCRKWWIQSISGNLQIIKQPWAACTILTRVREVLSTTASPWSATKIRARKIRKMKDNHRTQVKIFDNWVISLHCLTTYHVLTI